jgi:8-oxo-(d)GTP phosphatase
MPDNNGTGLRMNKPPVRAAGAVVWRLSSDGELEIVLVHRPKYDDWSLPKGKLDSGEHVLAAARREVEEETALDIALGRPLPTQHYLVDQRPKEVRYWAASVLLPSDFTPTAEIDQLRWSPAGDGRQLLTHLRDADVVDAFLARPIRTVPLLLLRHGAASSRTDWEGDDIDRPLSDKGAAQADALVDLLAAYDVQRVLSSDTRRCVDTVLPYASGRHITIETEPLLSEKGYVTNLAAARQRIAALIGSTRATVLSSHRPVLPELVTHLCGRSGIPAPAAGLEAGAFWVLHLAEGRIVDVEQHSP